MVTWDCGEKSLKAPRRYKVSRWMESEMLPLIPIIRDSSFFV